MAILYEDIKLMKSQRLDDSDEGGGRMTGNEVVDGEINNLFPDISRLDRTYGRVQLRKAFPAVLTNTTNPFYGGHLIIAKPAQDTNVKCCMCTTKSSTDVRADAIDKIQEYVVKGYRLFNYMLMGKHVAGSQALLVQQNINDEIPSTNSVLYLEEKEGTSGEYVKIQKIKIQKEDSQYRQLELTLWSPTQYVHNGFHYDENNRLIIDTYFYTSIIQDAMHYYGIKKLVSPATTGDSTVKVEEIFHNLVPCAQSSDALSNREAAGNFGKMWSTNADDTTYVLADATIAPVNGVVTIYCKRPLYPGSVVVKDVDSNVTATDDGNGNLSGGFSGTVDYENGVVSINRNYEHRYTVTATPAIKVQGKLYSHAYDITAETRTNVFALTLIPYPSVGSLSVRYSAQGKRYELKDNGDGTISGVDPSYGSGTIDYSTGAVTVSLGALPDINTAAIFSWSTQVDWLTQSEFTAGKLYIDIDLDYPILAGTLQIIYTANGVTKTVTDNNGLLTGNGTGWIRYHDKKIRLYPTHLPDVGSIITVDYTEAQNIQTEEFTDLDITDNGDGTYTLDLGHGINAGTVQLSFHVGINNYDYSNVSLDTVEFSLFGENIVYKDFHKYDKSISYDPCLAEIRLRDDGNGVFVGDANSSIDYTNGILTFSKCFSLPTFKVVVDKGVEVENIKSTTWNVKEKTKTNVDFCADALTSINKFTVKYADASSSTTHTQEITNYKLECVIKDIAAATTYQGSLLLDINGVDVFDSNAKLYDSIDAATGEWGAAIGDFDYQDAKISLSNWQSGAENLDITVKGCIYVPVPIFTTNLTFTTSARPLQVGSFQLLFTRLDTGEQVSIFADNSGYIDGSGAYGTVDYQTGIVMLQFGEWVPDDATAQNQDWYDPARVVGGNVLKPIPVFINSVKYNAVAIEYIPLDPSILGLNPLRLPTDGKVPIFRKGDVVVIHNTQEFTMPDNLTAGQQISLPRGDLSYVDLFDQDGKHVDSRWYSVNLATGVITMAGPLDLSAYTQPLIAYHRREDMRLLSDVSIDGTLSLIEPIDHDYDTDYTYVSSALLMGDLYASVFDVFDQKNWTGEWSDELIGDPCTANYNLIDYPIEVTNQGAIQERWAIIFISSTEFKVVGENIGEIAYGNTSADCAPINPETQVPYFTIRADGWGGGWATNNVLRFNTTAAHYPVWFVRTVLIGDATADDDNFRIQIRGDAD